VDDVMAETGADLLVVGSHGESGFRHATIGSVANMMLEMSELDTLMVKMPR
jgi:nucleotide-binding universal stress UspA family protein